MVGISDGEYLFFVLFSWALLSNLGLLAEVNPGELSILDVVSQSCAHWRVLSVPRGDDPLES